MKKEFKPVLKKKELLKAIINSIVIFIGYLCVIIIASIIIGIYFNATNFIKDIIFINSITILFSFVLIGILHFYDKMIK